MDAKPKERDTALSVLNTTISALNTLKEIPVPVMEPAKIAFTAVSLLLETIRVLFPPIARW